MRLLQFLVRLWCKCIHCRGTLSSGSFFFCLCLDCEETLKASAFPKKTVCGQCGLLQCISLQTNLPGSIRCLFPWRGVGIASDVRYGYLATPSTRRILTHWKKRRGIYFDRAVLRNITKPFFEAYSDPCPDALLYIPEKTGDSHPDPDEILIHFAKTQLKLPILTPNDLKKRACGKHLLAVSYSQEHFQNKIDTLNLRSNYSISLFLLWIKAPQVEASEDSAPSAP